MSPQAKLEGYTTFRLGGACHELILCRTPIQLIETVQRLIREKTEFILIGGGSNLVVSDNGIKKIVIRYVSEQPLIERDGIDVYVSASTALDDLALFCASEGLEGLNYTTGIPGTVGGAIVGNAGAFGKQVGDVLKTVTLIDAKGNKRDAESSELGFTYRHSNLKESGDIVVGAHFALKAADCAALLKEREEILAVRREKHPDLRVHPCAGSFFRNVEPTSQAGKRQAAGWFLEQAGAKNFKVGGAGIFEKHANIIVKGVQCTAQDVYDLHILMAKAVKEKFGFDLVREVRFVGDFAGKPADVKDVIW